MLPVKNYLNDNLLIFDGSMGTYFASKYKSMLSRCENVNISDPSKIHAIHEEYIAAGCKAIKTNTFAANLETYNGDKEMLSKVLQQGYNIALSAANNKDVYVFADIGYIQLESEDAASTYYKENVDIFLAAGAKNFLFETLSNDEGIHETAKYIKERCPESFIITSFAIYPDGYTEDGSLGYELLSNADSCEYIDVIGLNCISGPHHMYNYFKKLKNIKKPISLMPNAGYPRVINNRTFFESNPEYFAEKLSDMARLGARILGGCCGTTPKYLSMAVDALKQTSPVAVNTSFEEAEEASQIVYTPKLNKKLLNNEKIIAVELDSPEDVNIEKFLKNALLLKNAGIDCITIADCPIAKARVDSSLLACKLKREFDIDVIPHITCRDRNINATKALLLGLNIENIRNVLIVTGDPVPSAQRDEVKSVFNFNSRRLAKYVSTLNNTIFSDAFNIFGALNVNARNFAKQLELAQENEENGMMGFLTQPIMSEKALENLKLAKATLSGKILAGIMPIMSYRNACFMESEISGISVPNEIINAFKNKSKEESVNQGIEIAVKNAKLAEEYCDGYYLITPFARADVICEIIKSIK